MEAAVVADQWEEEEEEDDISESSTPFVRNLSFPVPCLPLPKSICHIFRKSKTQRPGYNNNLSAMMRFVRDEVSDEVCYIRRNIKPWDIAFQRAIVITGSLH